MAAALGHTQSLHTNSLDEAIALPTDFSARIARNTQLYLQEETGICRTVDPWAGSYYVEGLTDALIRRARQHIEEVESLGGMAKAIETGLPKMRIEEAAARRQAAIDSGQETIVGVNKYRARKGGAHRHPRGGQHRRARGADQAPPGAQGRPRSGRRAAPRSPPSPRPPASGEGNLLALAVEAAQARATLGEISDALEKCFGRHKAVSPLRSPACIDRSSAQHDEIEEVRAHDRRVRRSAKAAARASCIAKLGQDGHDRGAKVVATAYADLGFDVDIGPLFQTPEEAARQAVENDVHVVGMSSLAAGHKTLLPQLVAELKRLGREDIMVVCGGVIPQQDYDALRATGVAAIFGPGAKLPATGREIMRLLNGRLGHA